MIFSSLGESVDKPCDNLLTYPVQCFVEHFVSLPQKTLQNLIYLLGIAVVVFVWAILIVLVTGTLYFVAQRLYRLSKCFGNTKIGQKVSVFIPIHKLCCANAQSNAADNQKKFLSTQSIGEYGSSIVAKVHDAKWIKGVLKKRPFSRQAGEISQKSDSKSPSKSPLKTPQKALSRLSLGSPRLLSPKLK